VLVWALAGVLTATTPKMSNAAQERFLIAGRKLLGDARRLRKNCFLGALIFKSKFGVGQRQGVVGAALPMGDKLTATGIPLLPLLGNEKAPGENSVASVFTAVY